MDYLYKLLSADDAAADFVAWCGGLGVLALCGLAIYEAYIGHPPGIAETGTGLAAVIVAAGGVRTARERFCKEK